MSVVLDRVLHQIKGEPHFWLVFQARDHYKEHLTDFVPVFGLILDDELSQCVIVHSILKFCDNHSDFIWCKAMYFTTYPYKVTCLNGCRCVREIPVTFRPSLQIDPVFD
jgi:hypothetical protein